MKKLIFAILIVNVSSGCDTKKPTNSLSLDFEVRVQLSGQAESMLKKSNESVIVDAYLSGRPLSGEERITVGTEMLELKGSGTARFKGIVLSQERLKSLKDPDYDVLVNVASARKSHKNNLLNCGIIEGKSSAIQNKTLEIRCRLIGEH